MQGFIEDGYTLAGYIEARPRLHPALRFKYRAMLQGERANLMQSIRKATDAGKAEVIAAKAIAGRLVEWDLQDAHGADVVVSAENVGKLQPVLNERLFLIVTGTDAPDEDPEEPDAVVPPNEEADAKN